MLWIRNPSVWSVFVALVAVILSQLPPILTWFSRADLKIEALGNLSIYHTLGDIELKLTLDLRNSGRSEVNVADIKCLLSNAEGKVWSFTADSYFPGFFRPLLGPSLPHHSSPQPLPNISLQSGVGWTETIVCSRRSSTSDEARLIKLSDRIANDLKAKHRDALERRRNAFDHTHPMPIQTLNPKIVEEAQDIFEERFDFDIGDYTLLLIAKGPKGNHLRLEGYRFTAHQHHIEQLVAPTKEYEYGHSIFHAVHGMMPRFTLSAMDYSSAKDLFDKIEE